MLSSCMSSAIGKQISNHDLALYAFHRHSLPVSPQRICICTTTVGGSRDIGIRAFGMPVAGSAREDVA